MRFSLILEVADSQQVENMVLKKLNKKTVKAVLFGRKGIDLTM